MKIYAKLLGNPQIKRENQMINFPFKKAEILFYYLLVEKSVSRNKLVNLLWEETNEKVAKKNLRNAIYIIKKTFDLDILVSPTRSIIMLNPEIDFEIDVNVLLNENIDLVDLYSGEFLDGILVRDAENFQEWMFRLRDRYRDIYVNKLYKTIETSLKEKKFIAVESYCKKLIAVDEFDEEAYRILMKIYLEREQYNRGIDIYNRLVEILDKELSISPDIKSANLYRDILKKKASVKVTKEDTQENIFYGRNEELRILNKNYCKFTSNGATKSMAILGEIGIGKSRLIEEFIDNTTKGKAKVFVAYCYKAEENYIFKPWNAIFSKLSDLIKKEGIQISSISRNIVNVIFPSFSRMDAKKEEDFNIMEDVNLLQYQVIENAILDILKQISKKKKIIIIFEDIQWMDDMSISLLKRIILDDKNKLVNVMFSCRDENIEKIDDFMVDTYKEGLLERIHLKRFTKKEMMGFAHQFLPNYQFTENIRDAIYEETEGNTFFIVEFLSNLRENNTIGKITPKMANILKSKFLNISDEGIKIANIASIFFDKIALVDLQKLSAKNDLELMDIVEELQNKKILKEVKEPGNSFEDIKFIFTHQKLREYAYLNIPNFKRKILHNKIANHLEPKLNNEKEDVLLYSKLIYHYSKAGNKVAQLKYSIKNLDRYLQFNHEIFPILINVGIEEEKHLYWKKDQALGRLKEVENLLNEVRKQNENSKFELLEISFLNMSGRLSIMQGDYEEGLKTTKEMIRKAEGIRDIDFILKGYRQMIYYGMNTENTSIMNEYIEKALCIGIANNQKEQIGIMYRLKGILKVMEGDCEKAEIYLIDSIKILSQLNDSHRYILNIAASYNFIGECRRYSLELEEAIRYYEKAIEICEDKNLLRGLPIFYTYAGKVAFDMNRKADSKRYFKKALDIYAKIDCLWRKSIAYGYMTLLSIEEGEYEEAIEYFKTLETALKWLKNPYEIAIAMRVKAEVRLKMENNVILKKYFKPYLQSSYETYRNGGISLLKDVNELYEIDILRTLNIIK